METAAPANARLFGRCPHKGCPTRLVLDPTTDNRVLLTTVWGNIQNPTYDALPRTAIGEQAIVGGNGVIYCATPHPASGSSTHLGLTWSHVRGITTTMECDHRCWGGTGADCRCSCGGANHGMGA